MRLLVAGSPARKGAPRVAAALLWVFVPLTLVSPRPIRAADQELASPRGSLTVHPAGPNLQIVEWVGPDSAKLAWPNIDQERHTLLSLRVVPTGLPQVGLVAALNSTWGLELAGVPLSDADMGFLVKSCREVSVLRLRHRSTLSSDEFSDLTDDERAAYQTRTLSGAGLAQIERLKRLVLLEISGYSLPKTRLEFLSEMKQLRYLALCDMAVTDEDLRAVGQLPNLKALDLSGTTVTGSGLRHLCSCPALQCVMLNRAPITDELAHTLKKHPLPRLEQIDVAGCKFSPFGLSDLRDALPLFGEVIEDDSSLPNLAHISPPGACGPQEIRVYRAACQLMQGCGLATYRISGKMVTDLSIQAGGWIPASDWVLSYIAPLRGLKRLWLRGCDVSAEALENLQDHEQLEWLDLSSTNLDDEGLSRLRRLKSLRGVNFTNTRLTDAAADSLSQLVNLETLRLAGTQLTDRGLRGLQPLWRLQTLDLKHCPITDEGAQHLAGMPTLGFIELDDTRVTDRGVEALVRLPKLSGISCVNCKVTDDGANRLLQAEHLTYFKVEGTSISRRLRSMLADHVSSVGTSSTRFNGTVWDKPAADSQGSESRHSDDAGNGGFGR
jgi:Leucine-rich repeat (LRR) protein